jgi:hypothetical protein
MAALAWAAGWRGCRRGVALVELGATASMSAHAVDSKWPEIGGRSGYDMAIKSLP